MATIKSASHWDALLAGGNAIRYAPIATTAVAILALVDILTKAASKVLKPGDNSPSVGRWTGMRIMEFQDALYVQNHMKGWELPDDVLIALWKAEFPNAKCRFEEHPTYIQSARTDLNRSKRGLKPEQVEARLGEKFLRRFPKLEAPAKPKASKKAKAKVETTEAQLVSPPADVAPETVPETVTE